MSKRRRSKQDLFQILAHIRQSHLLESIEEIPDDKMQWVIDEDLRKSYWKELCDRDEFILAEELVREIQWALEGMDFAIERTIALHFDNFQNAVAKLDPREFLQVQLNYPVNKADRMAYRAALMLFSVTEVYFWMAAVWDRMGLFLDLFAFNIKNISRNLESWRQAFSKFRDNFGKVPELRESRDYRALVRLNEAYDRIQYRRNILAHKGSLAGRIRAGVESDPKCHSLFREYVLDGKFWDLTDVIKENQELGGKCYEASETLQKFVGDFLRWRRAKVEVPKGTS